MATDAPQGTRRNSELRMLDPRQIRLHRDPFAQLHLEIGSEERYGPVRAVRCLPLTRPYEFISLQDEEGREIGVIADLAELSTGSREAVEEDLEFYYLNPRVLRIHKVEAKNGIITWDLETDRGRKKVHVRDRQNIRPLPDGRTILTDIHNAKYEVPRGEELDPRSRQWLEIEL